MSLIETLAPHLPRLRRYARMLTGSQKTGDCYLRAALQGLGAAGDELGSLPTRLAFYKMFQTIWGATGAWLETPVAKGDAFSRQMMRIAPRDRQVFLLTVLEGFSVEEVAEVLDETPENVGQLIARARKELKTRSEAEDRSGEAEAVTAAHLETHAHRLARHIAATAGSCPKAA